MSQLKQTILQYYLFVSWDCFESHNHLLMPCVHQSRKSTWSADLFDELCVNNDTTESQVGSILKNHHRVPCDPFWEEPWQMRIKSPCSFTSSAFYINGMYFKRFDICFLFNNYFFCKCWFFLVNSLVCLIKENACKEWVFLWNWQDTKEYRKNEHQGWAKMME